MGWTESISVLGTSRVSWEPSILKEIRPYAIFKSSKSSWYGCGYSFFICSLPIRIDLGCQDILALPAGFFSTFFCFLLLRFSHVTIFPARDVGQRFHTVLYLELQLAQGASFGILPLLWNEPRLDHFSYQAPATLKCVLPDTKDAQTHWKTTSSGPKQDTKIAQKLDSLYSHTLSTHCPQACKDDMPKKKENRKRHKRPATPRIKQLEHNSKQLIKT